MAKELRSHFKPHKRVVERGEVIDQVGNITVPPSMTKQEFVKECDINNILKQYSVSGMLKHVSANQAQYQDLPDAPDFQESLHLVESARSAFMSLPSKLRARFGNDPVEFLAFCSDPENANELRELGLAKPLEAAIASSSSSEPPKENPSEPAKASGGGVGEGSPSPLRTAR